MTRLNCGPEPEVVHVVRSSRAAKSAGMQLDAPSSLPDEVPDAPREPEALWVCTFPDDPRAILFRVPEGQDLPALPALRAPFTKQLVGTDLGDAGLARPLVRVTDSPLGRWGASVAKLSRDARLEQVRRQESRRLAQARLLR